MPTVKPGYTTTQFWLTLLGYIVGIIALFKDIGDQSQLIQAAAIILAAIANSIVYAHGRNQIEKERVKQAAAIITQSGQPVPVPTPLMPSTTTAYQNTASNPAPVSSTVADSATVITPAMTRTSQPGVVLKPDTAS